MRRIFSILLLLLTLPLSMMALTPVQVLDKSASSLTQAGGIEAAYTLMHNGQKQTGSIKAKGKKFYIYAGGVQTWYDGKTQWNFQASSKEVTISTPTAAELATVSPYAMIASYRNTFNASAMKSNVAGTYCIKLTPKNSNSPVKQAIVYIRSNDFMPVKLEATHKNNQKSSIIITSIKKGVTLPDATFAFNKAKHPGVEVIDLR